MAVHALRALLVLGALAILLPAILDASGTALHRVDDKGESHWQFESFEDRRFVHPTDSNVFWMTLFGAPLVWALLGIGAVITLHFMWLLLCLVALGLCGINLYGYIRCKKDARTKLTALGGTVLSRGMEMWSGANARARGQQGGL